MYYFELFICYFRLTFIAHTQKTQHVKEPKTVLDSAFHTMDSGFQSLSVELGSLVESRIPDSTNKLSPIPESRFPYQKVSR